MKRNYIKHLLVLVFLLGLTCANGQEEETVIQDSIMLESDLLYNRDWKLNKMEPAFASKISLELNFEKLTNQLKVVKSVESQPVLKGTKLVTTKNETLDFYQWNYMASEVEYEGDDVKSVTYDYSKLELKAEGYAFKIKSITETELVLEVLKAPKAIFGNSIFDTKYIYFK